MAIEIDGVSFTYGGTTVPALRDIVFQGDAGEFIVVAGRSGCGKSSFIRLINGLVPHFHGGRISGYVKVCGSDVLRGDVGGMAGLVGFVFQNPESQMVCGSVEHEIAFGLENLGVPSFEIEQRVDDALEVMDISLLRGRRVDSLSGGEIQRVAIASVLAMQPRVIVLDEPTSQLDVEGASRVLDELKRLNHESGLTVVLAEHRLERLLGYADRVVFLDEGRVLFDGEPKRWVEWMLGHDGSNPWVPSMARIGWWLREQGKDVPLALSIAEAEEGYRGVFGVRDWVGKDTSRHPSDLGTVLADLCEVSYRYPGSDVDALEGVDISFRSGEMVAVVGRNGSGKSTLIRMLSGLDMPCTGEVVLNGRRPSSLSAGERAKRIGVVMQDIDAQLFGGTVEEEVCFMMRNIGWDEDRVRRHCDIMLRRFDLEEYRTIHPSALSVGERQRVVLCCVLAVGPRLLVVDEPTRGLDRIMKDHLWGVLKEYRDAGGCVVCVTHDIESVVSFADRVVVVDEGRIQEDGGCAVLSGYPLFRTEVNLFADSLKDRGVSGEVMTLDGFLRGWI